MTTINSIQVIGSAGAFDTHRTNSSFLISTNKNNILFDCGYNVFTKLKELEKENEHIIKELDSVIISHMDDDHIGSVKSLVYYRYFMYGKTTKIITSDKNFEYFNDINKEMIGSKFVKAKIIKTMNFDTYHIKQEFNLRVDFIKGNHHIESFGILIYDGFKIVAISGDTKAYKEFEDRINEIQKDKKIQKNSTIIFHDFSHWNAPSRNVHACEADYVVEYSKEFRNKTIQYHNNINDIEDNMYLYSGTEDKWITK